MPEGPYALSARGRGAVEGVSKCQDQEDEGRLDDLMPDTSIQSSPPHHGDEGHSVLTVQGAIDGS